MIVRTFTALDSDFRHYRVTLHFTPFNRFNRPRTLPYHYSLDDGRFVTPLGEGVYVCDGVKLRREWGEECVP